MKFEVIYETLQKVALGPVVTLVARDRKSNQKVIVHTFEYSEQAINQPRMRDVLSAFSAVAPRPVGSVIDAGKFDGTSIAYLVISWPGDEALAEWVRLYKAGLEGNGTSEPPGAATAIFGSDAAGTPTTLKARSGDVPEVPTQTAASYSPPAVHPYTPGAISGFWGHRENTTPPNPAEVVPRAPGAFTKEFFPLAPDDAGEPFIAKANGPAGSHQHTAAIPVDQRPNEAEYNEQASSPLSSIAPSEKSSEPFPKLSAPLMEAVEAGQFTDLFFKRIEPEEGVARQDIDERDKGGTGGGGEFTSFFKGPFNGEQPAPTPKINLDFTPQERVPGDFTRVFGSSEKDAWSKPQPFPDYQTPNSATQQGSSTEIFEPQETPQPNDAFGSDWQPRQASPAAPRDFTRPENRIPNVVPSQQPAADPLQDRDPFPGTSSARGPGPMNPLPDAASNATRVFSSRDAGPSMGQPGEPTAPSQWTIFQSSEKAAPVPREDPAGQQRQGWGSLNPAVPSPATPAIPSVQAPAIPSPVAPQVPISMQPPAMPTPSVPVLSSQSAPAPKPAFSYWPLVIVLNLLFIIAVLLVLYFALKH